MGNFIKISKNGIIYENTVLKQQLETLPTLFRWNDNKLGWKPFSHISPNHTIYLDQLNNECLDLPSQVKSSGK